MRSGSAVVDGELPIGGLERLRVVDASLLPTRRKRETKERH
jgi:choline dehydrogenase-like flavoprotein